MTSQDPLLPLPETPIQLPSGLSGEDRLNVAIRAAVSDANLLAMAWPAKNSTGQLVPPPAEHVLHELVHTHQLLEEEELIVSPRLCDVAFISELPACLVCGTPARYDARLEVNGNFGNGHLCSEHYLQYGSGSLGASGDAYLMLYPEVPLEIQQECNRMLAKLGREPLFKSATS